MALFVDETTDLKTVLPKRCYTSGNDTGATGLRLYGIRVREERKFFGTMDTSVNSSPIGGFDVTSPHVVGPHAAGMAASWATYVAAVRPDCRDQAQIACVLSAHDSSNVGRSMISRGIDTESDNVIPVMKFDDAGSSVAVTDYDLLALGRYCQLGEDQVDSVNATLLNRACSTSAVYTDGAAVERYPTIHACQVGSAGTISPLSTEVQYGCSAGSGPTLNNARQAEGDYDIILTNPTPNRRPVPLVTIEHTGTASDARFIWIDSYLGGVYTIKAGNADSPTVLKDARFHFMAFGETDTEAFGTETLADAKMNRLIVAGNGGTSNVMVSAAVVKGTTGGGAASFDADYANIGFSAVSGPNVKGAGIYELTLSLVNPAARYSFQPLYMVTPIWNQSTAVSCVVDTSSSKTSTSKVTVYCYDCAAGSAVNHDDFRLAVVALGVRT